MRLSIVTTLYRSSASIQEFYRRIVAAAQAITDEFELIFVNDGSPDDSLGQAVALHQADRRVVVVDLARNFGHHKAMMTGLAHARGDWVLLIDSDLEEEPELLTVFHQHLREGEWDVVYGVQEKRRGNMLQRAVGNLFFSMGDLLSDQPLPRNLLTARLMRRDYVRALVRHRDREFMIGHLWQLSGFRQTAVPVKKLSVSPTTYSLRGRIEMAVKYLTTTSTKLLYMTLYLGVAICLLSAAAVVYFVARYFFVGVGVDGWTSVIIAICFFGGLTTLILGIMGVYIATILSETKRRPYTVVRQVHRAPD